MRLAEWEVSLSSHPAYGSIRPFAGWRPGRRSLPWYNAYNDTKHDREVRLCQATLRNAITAIAGVFVMTVAQFGEEHVQVGTFTPDEFAIEKRPQWLAHDMYIHPDIVDVDTDIPLADGWRAVHCPALIKAPLRRNARRNGSVRASR